MYIDQEIKGDSEYFAIKALSASSIKDWDKSKYKFWKNSVFNPEKKPQEDKNAFAMGSLCHCLLLEPHKFDEYFHVAEFGKSRTNVKYIELKNKLELDGLKDKKIVNQEEVDKAKKMIDTLLKNELVAKIIYGSTAEMPILWRDDETGLLMKCKPDATKRTKQGIVVIDYKTSADIDAILKWGEKLNYPLQDATYRQGIKEKYGEEPVEFVFIIQSNQEDEEELICIATSSFETQDVAKDIYRQYVMEISEHLKEYEMNKDASIFNPYKERMEITYSNWYLMRGGN